MPMPTMWSPTGGSTSTTAANPPRRPPPPAQTVNSAGTPVAPTAPVNPTRPRAEFKTPPPQLPQPPPKPPTELPPIDMANLPQATGSSPTSQIESMFKQLMESQSADSQKAIDLMQRQQAFAQNRAGAMAGKMGGGVGSSFQGAQRQQSLGSQAQLGQAQLQANAQKQQLEKAFMDEKLQEARTEETRGYQDAVAEKENLSRLAQNAFANGDYEMGQEFMNQANAIETRPQNPLKIGGKDVGINLTAGEPGWTSGQMSEVSSKLESTITNALDEGSLTVDQATDILTNGHSIIQKASEGGIKQGDFDAWLGNQLATPSEQQAAEEADLKAQPGYEAGQQAEQALPDIMDVFSAGDFGANGKYLADGVITIDELSKMFPETAKMSPEAQQAVLKGIREKYTQTDLGGMYENWKTGQKYQGNVNKGVKRDTRVDIQTKIQDVTKKWKDLKNSPDFKKMSLDQKAALSKKYNDLIRELKDAKKGLNKTRGKEFELTPELEALLNEEI